MTTYEALMKRRRGTAPRTGPHNGQPGEIARDLLQSLALLLLLAVVVTVRVYVTAPF